LSQVCHQVHAEVARYILPFVGPRIILHAHEDTHWDVEKSCGILEDLFTVIRHVVKHGKITVQETSDVLKKEVEADYRHWSSEGEGLDGEGLDGEDCDKLASFANIVRQYLTHAQLPTYQDASRLRIATHCVTDELELACYQYRWATTLGHCSRSPLLGELYRVRDGKPFSV